MHIYVPLEPIYPYETVRTFGEALCRVLAAQNPKVFTLPRSLARRTKGRVYYDWMQVGRAKAISAPYSVRPRPGACVATPLDWTEVRPSLSPAAFHLRNAIERFQRSGDLSAKLLQSAYTLDNAVQTLDGLIKSNQNRP